MQSQMKAVAAAHKARDFPACLAALDEFGDSLRSHIRKQYGDAEVEEGDAFPRPPKACFQGKGFSGAFHIATMASYRAQSCLKLAKSATSATELVEFCASCLCPWVTLVDSSTSQASLQLHIDMENLCFSVLEASVRRFLPQKLVSEKATSRLATAIFKLCADSRVLLARGRQAQNDNGDDCTLLSAKLEALSRTALRLLALHRPKPGATKEQSEASRLAARAALPLNKCLLAFAKDFGIPKSVWQYGRDSSNKLSSDAAYLAAVAAMLGFIATKKQPCDEAGSGEENQGTSSQAVENGVLRKPSSKSPLCGPVSSNAQMGWPSRSVSIPAGFINAVLMRIHSVAKRLPQLLSAAAKADEGDARPIASSVVQRACDEILFLRFNCLPEKLAGIASDLRKKLGLVLYTAGAHLFNARRYISAAPIMDEACEVFELWLKPHDAFYFAELDQAIHSGNLPVRFKLAGVCWTHCEKSSERAISRLTGALAQCAALPVSRWPAHDIVDCASQLAKAIVAMPVAAANALHSDPTSSIQQFLGLISNPSMGAGSTFRVVAATVTLGEQLIGACPPQSDCTHVLELVRKCAAALRMATHLPHLSQGFAAVLEAKRMWWAVLNAPAAVESTKQDKTSAESSLLAAQAEVDCAVTSFTDFCDGAGTARRMLACAEAGAAAFWGALVHLESTPCSTNLALARLVEAADLWKQWVHATAPESTGMLEPEFHDFLSQRSLNYVATIRSAAQVAESQGLAELMLQFRSLVASVDGAHKSAETEAADQDSDALAELSDTFRRLGFRGESMRLLQLVSASSRPATTISRALVEATILQAPDRSEGDEGIVLPRTASEVQRMAVSLADDAATQGRALTRESMLMLAECEAALATLHHERGSTHHALYAAASALARCQRLLDSCIGASSSRGGASLVASSGNALQWNVLRLYLDLLLHVAKLWEQLGDARSARKYLKVAVDYTRRVGLGSGHRHALGALALLDCHMGIEARAAEASGELSGAAKAAAKAAEEEHAPKQSWLQQLHATEVCCVGSLIPKSQQFLDLHSLQTALKVIECRMHGVADPPLLEAAAVSDLDTLLTQVFKKLESSEKEVRAMIRDIGPFLNSLLDEELELEEEPSFSDSLCRERQAAACLRMDELAHRGEWKELIADCTHSLQQPLSRLDQLGVLRRLATAHLALVPQTALAPGAAGLDSDPQLRAAHDTLLRADILDRVAPAARETRTICRGLLVCAVDISSRGERGEPQSDSKLLDHVLTLNRSIGVTDRHRFLQRRRAGTRRYEYISSSLKQASVEGSQNAATDWGAVLEYLLAEPAVGLDCTPRSPEVSKALLKACMDLMPASWSVCMMSLLDFPGVTSQSNVPDPECENSEAEAEVEAAAKDSFVAIAQLRAGKTPRLARRRSAGIHKCIRRFGETIRASDTTLALSAEEAAKMNTAGKKKWWAKRRSLDADLGQLLSDIEERLVGGGKEAECTHLLSAALSTVEAEEHSVEADAVENAGPAESALQDRDLDAELDALCDRLSKLRVPELKEKLEGLGLKKSGRKADLVSRLAHAQLDGEPGDASVPVAAAKCKPAVDEERGALKCSAATAATPVILVLGETLQRLPLESMPCLRTNKHVSRMPALEHVFVRALQLHFPDDPEGALGFLKSVAADGKSSNLLRRFDSASVPGALEVDTAGWSYVINPGADLPNTEKRMRSLLTPAQGCGHGFVGKAPTDDEFAALLEESGLMLYCGHNAGEQFVGTRQLRRLQRCAATFLIGCSSGFLRPQGLHEPYGPVLEYIQAGAPAVVANLWDVTDGDIDRFTLALMRSWAIEHSIPNLQAAVVEARETCKLPFLVGAAAVCYGVPTVHAQSAVVVREEDEGDGTAP